MSEKSVILGVRLETKGMDKEINLELTVDLSSHDSRVRRDSLLDYFLTRISTEVDRLRIGARPKQ